MDTMLACMPCVPHAIIALVGLLHGAAIAEPVEFQSAWPTHIERTWIGPEYWANRLQDWQISGGRLECVEARSAKPFRTVHLLTRRLGMAPGEFIMRVSTGPIRGAADVPADAASGFLIGAGAKLDYRAAALVHHSTGPGGGILAAVDGSGRAVFRDMTAEGAPALATGAVDKSALSGTVRLELVAKRMGAAYSLTLAVVDPEASTLVSTATIEDVSADRLVGGLALVSHPGTPADAAQNKKEKRNVPGARFWFQAWRIAGEKIEAHDDRAFGPILCAQYTLSRGVMKMTAQMAPLGERDTRTVGLEVKRGGEWKRIATTQITEPGFTATFRVPDWDATKDTPYRVTCGLEGAARRHMPYEWSGTIRREPIEKPELVLAAFTGNHNMRPWGVDHGTFEWTPDAVWFPHNDLVAHVRKHAPDMLFFSGDQIYEGASPTRPEINNLDYLYKWYLWCWAFRDLAKDRPCICIPDDHDVYQGNLWGAGGRKAKRQDDGGYTRPVEFVKMVERTQTSHLPDPYDPAAVGQGIGVYYTAMNYGRISFAVLEDRKFKSSAADLVPEGKVVNGWFQNQDFKPAEQADVPGATLLGARQLTFLNDWSTDWSHGAELKAVLSQTIFANVATLPEGATSGKVIPGLPRLKRDEYPENEHLAADSDSNGWPQSGRNKALREMRRGFAVHIAGDQHLGSTIQYGIDEWHDAGFAICVPSIANFWPRRWYPPSPGHERRPGAPKYTGNFKDGFGNRMTVHAVSNPVKSGRKPGVLHDRAPGFGIVTFDKPKRTMTLACYPRGEDPARRTTDPYPGWPVTIAQEDNYAREPFAVLPEVRVVGLVDPVIKIIDDAGGEVVYALRIKGTTYRPRVFKDGTYTIAVGEPDTDNMKTVSGVRPVLTPRQEPIRFEFEKEASP